MEAAGEPGDRRSVSRERGGREESPDSRIPRYWPMNPSSALRNRVNASAFGLRIQGDAPDNVRGPLLAARKRSGESGYGKCHREYTAGELRPRRPVPGNTGSGPVSDEAHLARVKRWGKSPPPRQ
jgi:hypothetical protein